MTSDHEASVAAKKAFLDEVRRDPYRPRVELVAAVAQVTRLSSAQVEALLPPIGEVPWVSLIAARDTDQIARRPLDDFGSTIDLDQVRADLDDGDPATRRAAVDRLGLHVSGDQESRDLMLRSLQDSDPTVRGAAVARSWRFGDDSRGTTVEKLRSVAAEDVDVGVRVAAVHRLGRNGDRAPATVQVLMDIMRDPASPATLLVATLRAATSCATGYARVPAIVRSLLTKSSSADVLSAAMAASCGLTTRQDIQQFIDVAVDAVARYPDLNSKLESDLAALAGRVPEITDALSVVTARPDSTTRQASAQLWGLLVLPANRTAAQQLAELSKDADLAVRASARTAAAGAIARIGEQDVDAQVVHLLEVAASD